MADPSLLLQHLRNDPKHRDRLAELLLDAVVHTPAQSLIDAPELIETTKLALKTIAGHPKAIASLIRQIDERLAKATPADQDQTLGDLLPMTVVMPIQTLLADPVAPSRTVLAALMDHPGMRQLIEEMLTHELAAFGRKIRKLVPDAPSAVPGKRLASRLAGVAKGVAAAVGSELEKQMEERTRDFVDGALVHSTDRLIDRMASQDYAPQLATWRVDVLHALLSLPLREFQGEWHKINKDALATALSEILDALSQWEGLTDLLEQLSDQVWPSIETKTLKEILEPVDAVDLATQRLQKPMARMITRVLDNPGFENWMNELHAAVPEG